MALFRPYKHEPTPAEDAEGQAGAGTPRPDAAAGEQRGPRPTRRRDRSTGSTALGGTSPAPAPATGDGVDDDPGPAGETAEERAARKAAKARPTPTRREAEAARRERLNPSISKKEARRRAAEANRRTRMAQMAARDATPAKELLRDHIDARFSLGQLLLPALLLIVLSTFLQTFMPRMVLFSTLAMYLFIALVILDYVRMWRSYRRIAAERGIELERGLKMYGMNRIIQIRRMRLPKPRVKRGDSY